jgi:hypothetical protein
MARVTEGSAKKPNKKKTTKAVNKRAKPVTRDRDQDTTSVLSGPMQDTIREAFLRRP